jgi:hypothetical protein
VRGLGRHRLPAVLALSAAGLLLAPAAAQAASLGDIHPTFAIFGISIKDVVGKILKALVGFVVPAFAEDWASDVVTWLVAIPNVTRGYPSLRELRLALVPVGIGITGVCFTIATLEYLAAGVFSGAPMRAVSAFARCAVAIGAIAFFPKLLDLGITGTNTFTAELIRNRTVVDGINEMVGGALVLTAVAGALSLGLAAAASLVGCFFLAGLFIFKTGDTSILAILYVASPLVWGFYPLAASSCLARVHTAGSGAALLLPVVWAVIFATGGVLGRDALLWTNPAVRGPGLTDELETLARPFAALALLYVAYKAPRLLSALARSLGVSPAALMPSSSSGGGPAGGGGRRARLAAGGMQHAGDRFRGIRVMAAQTAGRGAGLAGARVSGLRDQAAGRARRAAGAGALNLAGATSPRVATGALGAVDVVGAGARQARRGAEAAGRGAEWWRMRLPAEGAAHRGARGPARAAFGDARGDARAQRVASRAPSRASAAGDRSRPARLPRPRSAPARVVALASGKPLPPRADRASARRQPAREPAADRRAPRGRAPLSAPPRIAVQGGEIRTPQGVRPPGLPDPTPAPAPATPDNAARNRPNSKPRAVPSPSGPASGRSAEASPRASRRPATRAARPAAQRRPARDLPSVSRSPDTESSSPRSPRPRPR